MRRYFAACAVAAAIGITGGTAVGLHQRQVGTDTATAAPTTTAPGHRRHHVDRLHQVLAALVAKGTITQAQADAITSAMADAAGKGHPGGPGRAGRAGMVGRGMEWFRGTEQAVAHAIGIPVDELWAQLRAHKTIAEIAQAHGVSNATVVQAIVDRVDSLVREAQSKGRLTAQQAARIESRASEVATRIVQGKGFGFGPGSRHSGALGVTPPPSSPPPSSPPTSTSSSPPPSSSTTVPALQLGPETTTTS